MATEAAKKSRIRVKITTPPIEPFEKDMLRFFMMPVWAIVGVSNEHREIEV